MIWARIRTMLLPARLLCILACLFLLGDDRRRWLAESPFKLPLTHQNARMSSGQLGFFRALPQHSKTIEIKCLHIRHDKQVFVWISSRQGRFCLCVVYANLFVSGFCQDKFLFKDGLDHDFGTNLICVGYVSDMFWV